MELMLMVDEIWATAIVALTSIIGIVVTQFLSFRSIKGQTILQTRASYFQEAFKDNMTAMHCVTQIEIGLDRDKNINRIHDLINEHPYNFSFSLLLNWRTIEEKLRSSEPNEGLKMLCDNIQPSMNLYSLKYYGEVLGIKHDEMNSLLEALKGTIRI
jgi:hypothetical protein